MKVEFDMMPDALQGYDLQGRVMVCWNIEQTTKEPVMQGELPKTMWQCDAAIAENNSRDAIIIAIIRSKYSIDEELALHRKKVAGIETNEFDAYNTFVEFAKQTAKKLLQP